MIFVIDVGNTNMTMGVFCGEKLAATFRIMTKTPRTSDEYGIMITQLLKNNGIEVTDIEGAIIASVVPDVMHSLTSSIIRYLKTKPLIVGPGEERHQGRYRGSPGHRCGPYRGCGGSLCKIRRTGAGTGFRYGDHL